MKTPSKALHTITTTFFTNTNDTPSPCPSLHSPFLQSLLLPPPYSGLSKVRRDPLFPSSPPYRTQRPSSTAPVLLTLCKRVCQLDSEYSAHEKKEKDIATWSSPTISIVFLYYSNEAGCPGIHVVPVAGTAISATLWNLSLQYLR